jgi:hypothetical protein
MLLEAAQSGNGEPVNLWVAEWTRDRPEARTYLIELWRTSAGIHRERVLDLLTHFREEVSEATSDKPEERKQLASAFVLPLADLIEDVGADELLLRVEEATRAASGNNRFNGAARHRCARALRLLQDWPDPSADEWIRSLYCCPGMDSTAARLHLQCLLWARGRDIAAAAGRAAAISAADPSRADDALQWISWDPKPEDRGFLLWIAAQDAKPGSLYRALESLEALGEGSDWWLGRLRELAQAEDPFLRLAATAALVRHGEGLLSTDILPNAVQTHDLFLRAEALRWLGEGDAERHFDLLRSALLEGAETTNAPGFVPAAEEAAYSLARLATPAAISALIQAGLTGPETVVPIIRECLWAAAESFEGRHTPVGEYLLTWRKDR